VSTSPQRPLIGRERLGSPIISIRPPGAYLRHRVAAERAFAARQRSLWHYRILGAVVAGVLYMLIGRDVLSLVTAKKDVTVMEVEYEADRFMNDLQKIASAASVDSGENMSPIAFTSGAALAEYANRTSGDSEINPMPIETCARTP